MRGREREITPRQAEALGFIRDAFERLGRPPTIRELGEAMGISSTNGVRYFLEVLEERGLIERSPRVSRGIRVIGLSRNVVPLLPGRGAHPGVGRHHGISSRDGIEGDAGLRTGEDQIAPHDGGASLTKVAGRSIPSRPSREQDYLVSIPLVGRVAAGEPLLAEQNVEEVLRMDRTLFTQSPDGSFALRVKGDSMVGAGILEGDLVIVRPDVRPDNGDIVVAYWEEEATVKRFFRRGRRVVLHPENENYEDVEIDPSQEDFRVLGKVVGLIRRGW